MAQPLAGYQWTSISALGTTVLTNEGGHTLVRVVFPGTYVGTVNFHDAATAGGTTSTSQIVSFGLPSTAVAGHVEIGARVKNGLLYQATGTPVLTAIWD